MSLTKWTRAPDRVIRFGDMPVMLWTKPGEMRAICGEVEIVVRHYPDSVETPYQVEIFGENVTGGFFHYPGLQLVSEPTAEFFEKHVETVLESLSQSGELFGGIRT